MLYYKTYRNDMKGLRRWPPPPLSGLSKDRQRLILREVPDPTAAGAPGTVHETTLQQDPVPVRLEEGLRDRSQHLAPHDSGMEKRKGT